MTPKPPICVVSPFLDKQHGTERCVAEIVERLADAYEIHIYSSRIEDVDLAKVVWHRIPALPGPHLLAYLWWFAANHLRRWWDRRFRGLASALVYSPGINCVDADLITVHAVFAQFRRRVEDELSFRRNPARTWPLLAHRRMYYRLIETLERHIYARRDLPLAIVSRKVGRDLGRFYGRDNHLFLVYHGLDFDRFNVARMASLRPDARRALGLGDEAFALLLIGNAWKSKGLPCLIEAVGRVQDARLRVLVVGRDDPTPYQAAIRRHGLGAQVRFGPPRPDVEFYYAAADAYVGPSLEDAFAFPPAEAMACGLPVITSVHNGGSEIITDGVDGIVLQYPENPEELATNIRRLGEDPALCRSLGEKAAETARQYTWERNAEEMRELFDWVLSQRQ